MIIKVASAGTEIVEAIAVPVPPRAAAENILIVISQAEEPSTLAATIELILKTLPLEAALLASAVANGSEVVLIKLVLVLPRMFVTLTMLGLATIVSP